MNATVRLRRRQWAKPARTKPVVMVTDRNTRSGAVAVAGCRDPRTGYASVGAGTCRAPQVSGRFSRRVKSLARKVARSRALKKTAESALEVAKLYAGAPASIASAASAVALQATVRANEEERSAARSARSIMRSMERSRPDPGSLASALLGPMIAQDIDEEDARDLVEVLSDAR